MLITIYFIYAANYRLSLSLKIFDSKHEIKRNQLCIINNLGQNTDQLLKIDLKFDRR